MRGLLLRGLIGSCLVFAGGFITNQVPESALYFLVAPLRWIGATEQGKGVGILITVAGLALLSIAWVELVIIPRRTPVRERLRFVRRAAAMWAAPLFFAPPLFSHDGWSYIAQGALTQAGRDPYVDSPGDMPSVLTQMVDPIWRYTSTPYGPVPITWGALCTEVTKDPTVLLFLQRVPVLVGLLLTAWAVPRLARRTGVDAALASALALASPLVLAHAVGGLHNDALLMGLVAVALVLGGNGRWKHGAAIVGFAAGVKFTAIVAVVPVVLLSLRPDVGLRARFLRLAVGGCIAAAVVALTGVPYGLGIGWLHALSVPGVVVTPASVPTALGYVVGSVLDLLSSPFAPDALVIARAIGMAAAVAIVIVLALMRPTGDMRSALVTTAGVFGAIILLSPVVHTWYVLVLVPVAAVALPLHRMLRLGIVLGVVLGMAAPLDSWLAGASVMLTAAAVLALSVVRTRGIPAVPGASRYEDSPRLR